MTAPDPAGGPIHVISADGTAIGMWRTGSGPPLVLVHGTGSSHERWDGIAPALAERFTLIAVDRRGRGASGDADEWAVEREFEDIAAVVEAVAETHDADVDLLGHSFGAVCALEASLLTPRVRRLVLYEPPILGDGSDAADGDALLRRFEALLAEGRREELVATFYREVARMPEDQIELLHSSPAWPGRVAAAHTLPREVFDPTYRFEPARFGSLDVPTLLLQGELSPPFFGEAVRAVAEALPRATVAVLPGQHHIAMDTAPELFVAEVVGFLEG